jgi:hypothetical protein
MQRSAVSRSGFGVHVLCNDWVTYGHGDLLGLGLVATSMRSPAQLQWAPCNCGEFD